MAKFDLRRSLQSRMDEMKQAQGLDGQPPRSNYCKRKREAIVRTYEEPLLPKLCWILFVSMLVLTTAMLLAEISAFLRFHAEPARFLRNLSTTCFTIWGIYAALLGICCALGMRSNAAGYWKRIPDRAGQDREEYQRSIRAIRRLNSRYRMYLTVALAGLLVWFALLCLFAMPL